MIYSSRKPKNKEWKIQELFTVLSWLKQYPTEHNHAGHWKSTENTSRSKSWKYVHAIQKLIDHKVKWIVPDPNNPPEEMFLVSINGTHCQILEPQNDPNKDWMSYKNKKPGLAYELVISVYEDKLLWINGPFCASVGDNTLCLNPKVVCKGNFLLVKRLLPTALTLKH
jgi:hypothetical protein